MLRADSPPRAAGFDAVEIQFPYEHEPGRLAAAARAANVEVVVINAPVALTATASGWRACRNCATSSAAGSNVWRNMRRCSEYITSTCSRVWASADEDSTARRTLVDNLALAAERLEGIARVLLEPINPHDVPGYLVDRFDAARSVTSTARAAVGLQFDVYHAACMGSIR